MARIHRAIGKLFCCSYEHNIGNIHRNVGNYILNSNIYKLSLIFSNDLQNVRFVWDSKTIKKKKQKGVKLPTSKLDEQLEKQNDDSEFENIQPGSGTVIFSLNSLRVDLVLKTAFGYSRSMLDQAFYKSLIRINGNKIFKKSLSLQIGDEADYIKGVSTDNPDHLIVSRVQILDLRSSSGNLRVKLNKFKNLTIENYEEPWCEEQSDESDVGVTNTQPSVREIEEFK